MDIKEYIASGILESYALGFTSDQERREVECLSSIYPELKTELQEIQRSLEAYAESIAVQPPKELKGTIMEAIKGVEQDAADSAAVTPTLKVIPSKAAQMDEDTKVVRMSNYLRVSIAASIALLIGVGYMYRSHSIDTSNLEQQLASIQSQSSNQLNTLEDSLKRNLNQQELLMDNATEQVLLAGTDLSPQSEARVFWNKKKEQFFLISDDLPTPEQGKQYQLWAIVDGIPVDLGILDKAVKITEPKNIKPEGVQAFAITLEKEGGSEVPTLEAMYVVGGISS